jgi:hypothetical protein
VASVAIETVQNRLEPKIAITTFYTGGALLLEKYRYLLNQIDSGHSITFDNNTCAYYLCEIY